MADNFTGISDSLSPRRGISANLSTIKLTFCKEKQFLVILNGAQRSEESL